MYQSSRTRLTKKLTQAIFYFSLCLAGVMSGMNAYAQGVNTARPLGTTNSPYGYYEYLPLDYNDNTNQYPILIFLHGMGEQGDGTTQLKEVLYNGPSKEVEKGRDFPFLIVSPQSPEWWNVDNINTFVEFVKKKYRVNADKVYMTGLSMGAMGTFDYAVKYPQQLAAVVPIAGKANLSAICNMTNVPLWAFHGEADPTVNVSFSIDAVKAYNACSPTPSPLAKLTTYPGVGHDSWTRTYDGSAGHDIYRWMTQYSRSGSTTTANVAPSVNAGSDKTITLPTSSLSLSGTASDSDGSIASVSWTKVSGSTVSMSGTSTLKLSLSNLLEGSYVFRLTAKDNSGATKYDDVKVTVNAATTSTTSSSNGLNYKYYTTTSSNAWKLLPDFSKLTPAKTGVISNFALTPKTQNDYFGFVFEGQVQIDAAGTYTFYSYSDDGSQLFINGSMVVNNDGTHGAQEKSGSLYLAAGKHNIKVTYFDYAYSETLKVQYAGPGISKQIIPNTKLYTASAVTTVSTQSSEFPAPSGLTADYNATYNSVLLNWTDNSSNESEFEIYMSAGNNSSYKQVGSTGANETRYVVTGFSLGQTYYFKLRAKNQDGYSNFSNEVTFSTSSTGSTSSASTADVYNQSDISSQLKSTKLAAYPNPASDHINIQFGDDLTGEVNVQLIDLSGKTIVSQVVETQEGSRYRLNLDNSKLKPGIYIIKLSNKLYSHSIRLMKN